MDGRQVRPCRFCGYAYKGRGLYADHGFAGYNLARHEDVCPRQQTARVEHEKRTRTRARWRALKRGVAMPGQLGFPFDGIPEVVVDE